MNAALGPNEPTVKPILGEDVTFPEQTDFLANQEQSTAVRRAIDGLLAAHITRPNASDHHVYLTTQAQGEIIPTPNGNIRVIVQERPIANSNEGEEEAYHMVMETIVEPVEGPIKETEICLGGYSLNTPAYYQDFFPYALTGKRFVFVNLLGGGTKEYQDRNLNADWLPVRKGEAGLEKSYYPESGRHIADLVERYAVEGQSMTLAGESTGGLVLANVLANQDYLSTDLLRKVNRVVLDAPVPTGRLPFGNWETFRTAGIALSSGQFGAVLGWQSEVGPQMLGKLMMTDLHERAKLGDSEAHAMVAKVAHDCFKATGIFTEMALKLRTDDPIVDLMNNVDDDQALRRQVLRGIDFNIFYRPGDRTLPQKKILAMAKRWAACGLNVVLAPGQFHPNSHMDLPGLGQKQKPIWRQHGVNGRLQPFQPEERRVAPEVRYRISD